MELVEQRNEGVVLGGGHSSSSPSPSSLHSDSFQDEENQRTVTVMHNNLAVDRLWGDTMARMHFDVSQPAEDVSQSDLLGTIKGVFLPSFQNILGVLLFLRLCWIVGQGGMPLTTLIVFLCVTSTVLTSLSMSAIATNGRIQEGGPYYIISRNLGVELGGAIGLLFYLGTTIAASMYILGAIEAILTGFEIDEPFPFAMQVFSLVLALLLASVVSVGVKYVNMSSMVFLSVVILSLIAFIIGLILTVSGNFDGDVPAKDVKSGDNMSPAYEKDPDTGITPSFFSLLSLFYPSVTGIMAGCNRSGVLSDPSRSIPYGTLGAIAATTVLYLFTIWTMGSFFSNEVLKEDKLIVASVAFPHSMLVKIGIIMSSVGAGLQSLTGAPRLLAAIANDGVVPFLEPFASPKGKEPLRAVWVTYVIASLPCLAGNLDFITPIITMFFLLTYSSINLSTFILSVMKTPGFRPTWKYYSSFTSFLGFVWCLGLMLVISWYTALIAIFLAIAIVFYVKLQGAEKDWGDALSGLKFNYVRDLLLSLSGSSKSHAGKGKVDLEDGDEEEKALMAQDENNNASSGYAKNWRPQILIIDDFNDDEGGFKNKRLLTVASQLKKGRGITFVVGMQPESKWDEGRERKRGLSDLESDEEEEEKEREDKEEILNTIASAQAEKRLSVQMLRQGLVGFGRVVQCPSAGSLNVSFEGRQGQERRKAFEEASKHFIHTFRDIVQLTGIGMLSPNTVLIPFPDSEWQDAVRRGTTNSLFRVSYLFTLKCKAVVRQKKALIVLKGLEHFPNAHDRVRGTLDVWWILHDGGLMLLLPYLLSLHKVWRQCKLRLFVIPRSAQTLDGMRMIKRNAESFLSKMRIQAEVEVIDLSEVEVTDKIYQQTMDVFTKRRLQRGGGGEGNQQDSPSVQSTPTTSNRPPSSLTDLFKPPESSSSSSSSTAGEEEDRKLSPLKRFSLLGSGNEEEGGNDAMHLTQIFSQPQTSAFGVDASTERVKLTDIFGSFPSPSKKEEDEEEEEKEEKPTALSMLEANDSYVREDDEEDEEEDTTRDFEAMQDLTSFLPPVPPSSTSSMKRTGNNNNNSDNDGGESKPKKTVSMFDPPSREEESERKGGNDSGKAKRVREALRRASSFQTDQDRVRLALEMNHKILKYSKGAELVITNLPIVRDIDPMDFMGYLDALTTDLDRVMLVRGSGKEIITSYG